MNRDQLVFVSTSEPRGLTNALKSMLKILEKIFQKNLYKCDAFFFIKLLKELFFCHQLRTHKKLLAMRYSLNETVMVCDIKCTLD